MVLQCVMTWQSCHVVGRSNWVGLHKGPLTTDKGIVSSTIFLGSRGTQCNASAREVEHVLECEAAKSLLDSKACLFVDMRSEKEYDYEHITKPPRMTVNIPYQGDVETFVSRIQERYSPDTGLLLVSSDGESGVTCAAVLRDKGGYTKVYGVDGGYQQWMQQFTTSGRRRIVGKFVSSGKEALKSGLNLDPEVASTYEENWGKPEKSLPSNRS